MLVIQHPLLFGHVKVVLTLLLLEFRLLLFEIFFERFHESIHVALGFGQGRFGKIRFGKIVERKFGLRVRVEEGGRLRRLLRGFCLHELCL